MAFNPLAAFDNLRNAGFDETQARAITQTSEMAREGMATVTDLLAMEARLKEHNGESASPSRQSSSASWRSLIVVL